ncbi:hypothetical protein GCM10009789_82050 [Kribbella sancticallisti]|uniref:Uncharacterized protein n=2 Tax=Kribbella sancticallisti TaxID=460087 RepID=A0ABN2ERN5_9ACTN
MALNSGGMLFSVWPPYHVGMRTLDETIVQGHDLVSDLIRRAGMGGSSDVMIGSSQSEAANGT